MVKAYEVFPKEKAVDAQGILLQAFLITQYCQTNMKSSSVEHPLPPREE